MSGKRIVTNDGQEMFMLGRSKTVSKPVYKCGTKPCDRKPKYMKIEKVVPKSSVKWADIIDDDNTFDDYLKLKANYTNYVKKQKLDTKRPNLENSVRVHVIKFKTDRKNANTFDVEDLVKNIASTIRKNEDMRKKTSTQPNAITVPSYFDKTRKLIASRKGKPVPKNTLTKPKRKSAGKSNNTLPRNNNNNVTVLNNNSNANNNSNTNKNNNYNMNNNTRNRNILDRLGNKKPTTKSTKSAKPTPVPTTKSTKSTKPTPVPPKRTVKKNDEYMGVDLDNVWKIYGLLNKRVKNVSVM